MAVLCVLSTSSIAVMAVLRGGGTALEAGRLCSYAADLDSLHENLDEFGVKNMLTPSKEALKRKFEKHRETKEYREEFERLMELQFQDFMKEFLDFHTRVTEDMMDEIKHPNPSIEEREWFYLYYGGELYSDVIKAKKWGRMVDLALELIDKEQQN